MIIIIVVFVLAILGTRWPGHKFNCAQSNQFDSIKSTCDFLVSTYTYVQFYNIIYRVKLLYNYSHVIEI